MRVDAGTSVTELLRSTDVGIDGVLGENPLRLTGGRSNDVFKVQLKTGPSDLVDRSLVLKIESATPGDPLGGVVQQCVAALGFPAPQVLRLGMDDAGRACTLMDWVDGPPLFAPGLGAIRASRVTPQRIAELMLLLHRIDPSTVQAQLKILDTAEPRVELRALADIEEYVRAANAGLTPQLLEWLGTHRPTTDADVICHGDLHGLNVLVASRTDVAIDWEAAGLGPREFDVAKTKVMFEAAPFKVPKFFRPALERVGRLAAQRFERTYCSISPLDVEALRWCEVLNCARIIGRVGAAKPGEVDVVTDGWRPTIPFLRNRVEEMCGVPLPPS